MKTDQLCSAEIRSAFATACIKHVSTIAKKFSLWIYRQECLMFSVILVAVRRTSASCNVSTFRWASDLRMEQYCAINAWTDLCLLSHLVELKCFTKCLPKSPIWCTAIEELVYTSSTHCAKKWLHFRTTFGGISKHKIQTMADTVNIHGIWRMVDDTLCIRLHSFFFRSMPIIFLFNFLVTWLGGP